jgi:thioredoxin reductase
MREVDLVVVGAGPAGCAAARTAASLGLATLLVDENPLDPAYLARNVPQWYGARVPTAALSSARVYRWLASRPDLQAAVEAGAEPLTQHSVWGIFPDRTVGLYDGRRTWLVQARQLILATGTTDLHLAFPGWTLGGVLGGNGALQLLDLYGRLEARRLLVLGSGNLALEIARRALAVGIELAGVVEIAHAVQGDPDLWSTLADAGVPLFLGHTVRAAEGSTEVERIVLIEVAPDGRPGTGETVVAADTLCVAIGRQPAVESAYLAGCTMTYAPHLGGFFPRHDAEGRTSRPGVLVAGDLAGADDRTFLRPEIAAQSGQRAAIAVAQDLGRLDPDEARRLRANASPPLGPDARGHHDGFPTLWHQVADLLAPDDLIICRCEEVTRGSVLAAAELVGMDHPDEVKRVSRAGMGLCQGRGCRPLVAALLAAHGGRPFASLPLASYRPPLRALPLAALATEEERPLPELPALAELEQRLIRDIQLGILHPTAMNRFRHRADEVLFACLKQGATDDMAERLAADLERQIRYAYGREEGGHDRES